MQPWQRKTILKLKRTQGLTGFDVLSGGIREGAVDQKVDRILSVKAIWVYEEHNPTHSSCGFEEDAEMCGQKGRLWGPLQLPQ